jgi:hypothetical protein
MENLTEIKNAIHDYLSALQKMRQLNIAPNSKDFTSQLGEWLVEQIYEGKRAESGIQRYWDVLVENKKIQVKTHAKASKTDARWSYIKFNIHADIDDKIYWNHLKEFQENIKNLPKQEVISLFY